MNDIIDEQQKIIRNFIKKMKDEVGNSPTEIKTKAICGFTWKLTTDEKSTFILTQHINHIVISVYTSTFLEKNKNDLLILCNALNGFSFCGDLTIGDNNIVLKNTNFYKLNTFSIEEIAYLIDKVFDWFTLYVVSGAYYFDEKMSVDEAIKKAITSLKKNKLN